MIICDRCKKGRESAPTPCSVQLLIGPMPPQGSSRSSMDAGTMDLCKDCWGELFQELKGCVEVFLKTKPAEDRK